MHRWVILAAWCGCAKTQVELPYELGAAKATFAPRATRPPVDYDPLRLAAGSTDKLSNPDPAVPSLCYTRTDSTANPCASCHTRSSYPNLANDWELQQNYPFHELVANPWLNQFRDRRAVVAGITDDDLATYVRIDNYAPLRAAIAPEFPGWRPDVDLARGFDELGFAKDGSGWRALRYKPFPTQLPSTGSTDDAYIRLPAEFRRDASGTPSLAIYRTNLAILEAAIAGAQTIRTIEPIDETASGIDLDRDGALGIATHIGELPPHYAGGAARIAVTRALYPQGVELLHSVRYLDPDAPAWMSTRMKELRYATKVEFLEGRAIAVAHRTAEEEGPTGDPLRGYRNGKGWQLQGWIEDAGGWLRLQTHEEHQYCMGCHTNLGITVDHTFSFPRKLPGAAGWRTQDPRAVPDVPQLGATTPELAQVAARTGKPVELYPTRARAWAFDRAYLANVIEQSYVWGREASVVPVLDAHARIGERSTGLGENDRVVRESRLVLQWD